ncbi:hypothetical protein [Bacillus cereus group sp. TH152-1LC]|uniref:hypothetical protein n=1 Tax=Bacillus cereus group sp. TH152-1LC TaxID=3018060 RepID=UPI0022E0A6C8|nr:hypothetical protein [Bacillus cereus group sp. TH152-1LC]MDA1674980.1 hypothetical protein [Bacillus cereus group sp. TH152-1LC]
MGNIVKYRHGSEDSLDIDVVYVFEKMPTFQECQEFCSDKQENRNIMVIENGTVVDCFKGSIDELNNGLYDTYDLHEQECELRIKRKVERDVLMKVIRAVRCILSHCSRTSYRKVVKKALKSSSWTERVQVLQSIDIHSIDDYGKSGSKEDIFKVFAFQIGQAWGLLEGMELYTKSSISTQFPLLKQYLYREPGVSSYHLSRYLSIFLEKVSEFKTIEVDGFAEFLDFKKKVDLKKEAYVSFKN